MPDEHTSEHGVEGELAQRALGLHVEMTTIVVAELALDVYDALLEVDVLPGRAERLADP